MKKLPNQITAHNAGWPSQFRFAVLGPACVSYRLKDHATVAGKEDKNKKRKSDPIESSAAGAAS